MNEQVQLEGKPEWARLPVALGALLGLVLLYTLIFTPAGRLNWLLEVGPGLAAMLALGLTYRRFPMSKLAYAFVFLHVLILAYGGYYTYAKAPLGEWARAAFGLHRNDYDKLGHFAFGFFPVLLVREVLLRKTRLERGGWLVFLLLSVIMGAAAVYELFEWWMAVLLDPAGGDVFLGTQGDVWDAQSDMLFAGLGAAAALATLSRVHDRSLARLFATLGPGR